MKTAALKLLVGLLLALHWSTRAEPSNANTGWFSQAKYGVFIHFLPSGQAGLKQVDQFDVKALAGQLEEVGAGYLVLTLDMGPNYDPAAGPVGQLAPDLVRQVKAIRAVLREGAGAAAPKRLKRADSFFGIHFDFHAGL